MKIAILGDTHFDANNSDEKVLSFQLEFFRKQFIPYLIKNNINTFIQLGDFMDNRRKTSVYTLHHLNILFEELHKNNITGYFLIGNHDIFYKDTLEVNSMWIWEKMYPNINLITSNKIIEIHNKQLMLVPWLLPDEKLVPSCNYIFGHFEINGAEMVKGMNAVNAELSLSDFKGIPVFSGHFHLRRYYNNVYYVGTPYQANWNDYEEIKGFHTLDLATNEIVFIENKTSPKHIKCYLDIENKVCTIEGLGEKLSIEINAKTDYNVFKNHKCKILMDKDVQFSKKFVENVSEVALSIKIDIVKAEIEQEKIEYKDFSVVDELRNRMDTDYKKIVFEDILKEATLLLDE